MNRVMPPSTGCSYTMSACFRPACGRATERFSTFTANAGRAICSSLPASLPVSGHSGGSGGLTMSPMTGMGTFLPVSATQPHAAAASATTAPTEPSTIFPRRLSKGGPPEGISYDADDAIARRASLQSSHLFEEPDPVLDGWMGGEEPLEPAHPLPRDT